jgi:uncharacterized DUF497 family protein
MITWDEAKRQRNLRDHGIDLALLERVFDFPMVTEEDKRQSYGELRLRSLGMYDGRVVFLVWTERPPGAHMISCRYAERHETKAYFAAL